MDIGPQHQGTAFASAPEPSAARRSHIWLAGADRTPSAALAEAKTAGVSTDSLKVKNPSLTRRSSPQPCRGARIILMAGHGAAA